MRFELTVLGTIAGILGLILGTWGLIYSYLYWRYRASLARAREIAARLRQPASTFAEMEDQTQALEELANYRDPDVAIQAARELLGGMEASVRSSALEVLRRTRALDLWTRDARRGKYRARVKAIAALGDVGDERAVEELIELLGDDDPDVARAASRAVLARDPDYASDRLAEALASPNRRIAETAAAVLVGMESEAIEPLMSQLNHLSVQARRLAVESLGVAGDESLVPALLQLLETDPQAEVRVAAMEAVARLGGRLVSPALRQAAQRDPDWFVRARAYGLLAQSGDPEAAEFLLEALSVQEAQRLVCSEYVEDVEVVLEGPARVRGAIIAGLRSLGVSEEAIAATRRFVVPALVEAPLHGDSSEDTDWATVAAGMRSRDPVERAGAAKELAEAGCQGLPHLHSALGDPDPLVRAEAARSLGRVGRVECLQSLSVCLHDPDQGVRLAAAAAVRAIVTRDAMGTDL